MYLTTDKGEGKVIKIGEFENVEEIEIPMNAFDRDSVITFINNFEPDLN